MKKHLTILFLLTLLSCSKNRIESIDGIWEMGYNEEPKNIYFPFELSFEKDSLILTDSYNFKHQVKYKINGDSIEMNFNNKIIKKVNFKYYSDSIISLDSKKFYKKAELFFNRPPYNLLNYQANETLTNYDYSSIIHLVRENNILKVILNDKVTDLDRIPGFLVGCNKEYPSPPIILYIQKGIEFKDLIETYFWIKASGINSVILVTKNDTYQKFYSIKDYIRINNLLMTEFIKKYNIPPLPPSSKESKGTVFIIDKKTNFENLPDMTDKKQYLLEVSNELDLIQYLKLTEKIKDRKNIKKEITAYNKLYN